MDDVDDLVVPDDVRAALDTAAPAGRHCDAFPPSTRRNILRWVASARQPDTRAKRVAATTNAACNGRQVKSKRMTLAWS